MANITRTTGGTQLKVRNVRQPSSIREMGDVEFGTLDSDKDNFVVSYDLSTNRFIVVSADDVLTFSALDLDVPDDFVRSLEPKLFLDELILPEIDGGTF